MLLLRYNVSSFNLYWCFQFLDKRISFAHGNSRLKLSKKDTVQSYQCRNSCVLVAMNERREFLPINHLSDLFRNSIKSLMSEGSDFPEWNERIALNVICVLITHGAYRINSGMIVSIFSQSLTNSMKIQIDLFYVYFIHLQSYSTPISVSNNIIQLIQHC